MTQVSTGVILHEQSYITCIKIKICTDLTNPNQIRVARKSANKYAQKKEGHTNEDIVAQVTYLQNNKTGMAHI